MTLQWNASTGCPPATYVVRAGSAPGATNLAPGVVTGGTNTQFVATNVPSGRYYIRVAGRNEKGDSADSNEVMVDVG